AHKVTRKTPFEVVYGRRPRLPVDNLVEIETPQPSESVDTIRDQAKAAIRKEAQRVKSRYDQSKNTGWRDLDGQKVYWKNLSSNPKEGKHFAPRYKGPFLAAKTESQWNYRITDRDGNFKVVNVNQLKQ